MSMKAGDQLTLQAGDLVEGVGSALECLCSPRAPLV